MTKYDAALSVARARVESHGTQGVALFVLRLTSVVR
jgi:hypothetical protein